MARDAAGQPGPMRAAFDAADWTALLGILQAKCVEVDGCWLWPRVAKGGYGRIVIGGRTFGAHRLAAMASLGREIDSHEPVHHKCAERLCINPDHLQIVTPHENLAEMLERNYYQQRIAALESALEAHDPTHPLLIRISRAA